MKIRRMSFGLLSLLLAATYALCQGAGVRVNTAVPGWMHQIGLRSGDTIVRVNNQEVRTFEELRSRVIPGRKTKLTYVHLGKKAEVWLIVDGRIPERSEAEESSCEGSASHLPSEEGALDFKGNRLGMSLCEVEQNVKSNMRWGGLTCEPEVNSTFQCSTDYINNLFTGKQTSIQGLTFYFVDNRLASIIYLFPSQPEALTDSEETFVSLSLALLQKHGRPTTHSVANVQTKAGARYKSETALWDNGVSTLKIQQYCGSIQNGCITVEHRKLEEERLKKLSHKLPPV